MASNVKQMPSPTATLKPGDNPKTVLVDQSGWHAASSETIVFLNDHSYECEITQWPGKEFPFDVLNNKVKVPGSTSHGPGATVCKMKSLPNGKYTYGVSSVIVAAEITTSTTECMMQSMSSPKDVIIP